jgi:hypothetical protein
MAIWPLFNLVHNILDNFKKIRFSNTETPVQYIFRSFSENMKRKYPSQHIFNLDFLNKDMI